ncbi:MAG: hypothetical protein Ct9H90mP27_4550 [Gammaproteobacteria bacterium]|nr:MAG: hypothetical protein Ct9H90mP27_4550 [Gammaproteobacteria bacterium]
MPLCPKDTKGSRINELIGLARMIKFAIKCGIIMVSTKTSDREPSKCFVWVVTILRPNRKSLKAKWNEFPSDVKVLVCEGIEDQGILAHA